MVDLAGKSVPAEPDCRSSACAVVVDLQAPTAGRGAGAGCRKGANHPGRRARSEPGPEEDASLVSDQGPGVACSGADLSSSRTVIAFRSRRPRPDHSRRACRPGRQHRAARLRFDEHGTRVRALPKKIGTAGVGDIIPPGLSAFDLGPGNEARHSDHSAGDRIPSKSRSRPERIPGIKPVEG